ncbi:MAG: hypothetical protein ACRDPS_16815 [Nocardioides sp.]|uniref:hypothetical protein n=1 Tax=Nocardioides sp. TaxID=35761 RepID=UPI003D6BCAB0
MSVHIEWLYARHTTAEVIAPGEDWVGADLQHPDKHILALSNDEVTAIEGTPEELHALADRIHAAIPSPTTPLS